MRYSLLTLLLLVTSFGVGLGVGLVVSYERGYAVGYQEGPLQVRPGTPNWTPPSPAFKSSLTAGY